MAQKIHKHRIATKKLTKHRCRDNFILFGSLLEAVVATDAICNYSAELQKRVKLLARCLLFHLSQKYYSLPNHNFDLLELMGLLT